MEVRCDICSRTGGSKLPFLCPTDARNHLYDLRIQQAGILIDKDGIARQADDILSRPDDRRSKSGTDGERSTPNRPNVWEAERIKTERDEANDRTQQIISHAEELKAKIDAARAELLRKRTVVARRKSELVTAMNGLQTRRSRHLEEVERKTRMTTFRWNQLHQTTVQSRVFLCSEAANLYGLRLRSDDDLWHEEFGIGGVGIQDLRALNAASPIHVTTSLSHVAHLLVLTTHYLAIRLPAEITLPHQDYPSPTIFSLASSHLSSDVSFPGSTTAQSRSNSPTTSRELLSQPRPRPLFLHKPLPQLAKEDPSAYALFLEGVTLLAYDIAWVCRSQGISISSSSSSNNNNSSSSPSNSSFPFEDMCDIGQNLFELLVGTRPRPGPPDSLPPSTTTTTTATATTTATSSRSSPEALRSNSGGGSGGGGGPAGMLGQFSHGTAHTFLAGAEGTEMIRGWRLPSPVKLADRLKAHLMAEVHAAEWELLDRDAWAEEEEEGAGAGAGALGDGGGGGGEGGGGEGGGGEDDDGVLVGRRRTGAHDRARSHAVVQQRFTPGVSTGEGENELERKVGRPRDRERERKQGASGWTKLKPR